MHAVGVSSMMNCTTHTHISIEYLLCRLFLVVCAFWGLFTDSRCNCTYSSTQTWLGQFSAGWSSSGFCRLVLI